METAPPALTAAEEVVIAVATDLVALGTGVMQTHIAEDLTVVTTHIPAAEFLAPAPSLRLGQISERLGFTVPADFVLSLGFAPAATDKAAKLYHESDFPRICAALQRHIAAVQSKFTTTKE